MAIYIILDEIKVGRTRIQNSQNSHQKGHTFIDTVLITIMISVINVIYFDFTLTKILRNESFYVINLRNIFCY